MGRAILNYDGFQKTGIKIVAAFDIDDKIIGTEIHDRPVFPLEKMQDLAERLHVRIGILSTPASSAQKVAEIMVESGIIGIWNFTPVKLELPEDVIIENVNIYPSLAVLSHRVGKVLSKGQ